MSEDETLLRRFEPVLAFAEKERFHPLPVEAYLASCDLFQRDRGWRRWLRPARKVTDIWDQKAGGAGDAGDAGARRGRVLGSFDSRHFLRFLDPEVRRAQRAARAAAVAGPHWASLLVALALVGFGCWYAYSASWPWLGRGLLVLVVLLLITLVSALVARHADDDRAAAALLASFSAAVLAFVVRAWVMEASWRHWGTFVAALLIGAAIGKWGKNSLNERAAESLGRLVAAPITLAAAWLLFNWLLGLPWAAVVCGLVAVVGLVLFSDDLVAAYMAVFSSLRREASEQAVTAEKELREPTVGAAHRYYGRVWRGPDGSSMALQYFFFYAFNDWRGQGGLNLHEADWEWATVVLKRQGEDHVARELLLSQHHSVGRRPWDEVELTAGGHPVVYVAVGSHANYFEPAKRLLPDLIGESGLKGLVSPLFRSVEESRRAAEDGVAQASSWRGRRPKSPPESLSTADDPNGRGLVLGAEAPAAGPASRQATAWSPVVLDGSQPWVDYRGLWGVRARLRNESGPPGPKWEREENLRRGQRRAGRPHRLWQDPVALRNRESA